ncbi:hypothetical protein BFJ69_g15649 [Fusarium oxysporum]|uniref:Uncharacterized protein n=1 Tax=Fusarium oxysporum TaxID=5507 RepID=A0A420MDN6_FUSOX|nr:hypothetical protein BFJ69_g15649 [Fusarium oxysporum]
MTPGGCISWESLSNPNHPFCHFSTSNFEVLKTLPEARGINVLRKDSIARSWWKKDDTFWVPRADVIVSLKTPLIYASPESNVKARLFSDLVRDALQEYSYEAELAGLQYNWPILRSLILAEGSNYVFRKTIKYPANVNHSVETWFYVGSREDRNVRTKALLLDQMLHEPAFDQLRTKGQLGYIVFSGPRAFSTTYGFRFLIQSEMTPEFLDSRIESFLMRYADTMEKMSETENLDQESTRHWSYDFELAQRDAAQIKLLTKPEVEDFFNQRLNPAFLARGHGYRFICRPRADEEPSPGDAVKTDEEITDVRLYKARLTASSGAKPVKDISEYEDADATL